MKYFLSVFVLAFLMIACAGEESSEGSSSEDGEDSAEEPTIDMDGPDIEINVLSFSREDRKTEVELINRLDEDIREIKGELVFQDSTGAALTDLFFGNEKTSPFQKIQNPALVKSKSSITFELGNKIDKKAEGVGVKNIVVTTTSGEEIEVK